MEDKSDYESFMDDMSHVGLGILNDEEASRILEQAGISPVDLLVVFGQPGSEFDSGFLMSKNIEFDDGSTVLNEEIALKKAGLSELSLQAKQRWEKLRPEVKARIKKASQDGYRKYWMNLSDEDRSRIKESHREFMIQFYANMSQEDKDIHAEKCRKYKESLTTEERMLHNQKISEGIKKAHVEACGVETEKVFIPVPMDALGKMDVIMGVGTFVGFRSPTEEKFR
jgi:hypothetical protein